MTKITAEGGGGRNLETCLSELVKQIYMDCVQFQAKLFTLAMDWGNDITDNGQLMVFIHGAGNAFQAHEGLDSSCRVRDTSTGELLFLKLHERLM
jgi:hypothetical protein